MKFIINYALKVILALQRKSQSTAETWVDALNGREFLGGSKPNLADIAVFGVLRPIRYLRSGRDMVEQTRIGDWYTRMENAVGVSARIKA
ncbi:hypothetical protein OIU84_001886 [Salix udensis]|uniref:GST C-terminal domain-containing protein n=1 Tax=Salix udensis TaxID=889485 RepID=A0AAD6K8H9_9ROSI|nr:hypothetical protein OIU84_001886 [Salix udensis]